MIRKELRLLRPLWLISPLVVMYVSGLAMFGLLPTPRTLFPQTALEWALLSWLYALRSRVSPECFRWEKKGRPGRKLGT